MITNRSTALIAAMLSSGMLARDNGLSLVTEHEPVQTNAIDPALATPEPESRQVRRARRRALLKHSPPSLYIGAPVGRSKYLPHESVKRGGTGPKFAA